MVCIINVQPPSLILAMISDLQFLALNRYDTWETGDGRCTRQSGQVGRKQPNELCAVVCRLLSFTVFLMLALNIIAEPRHGT